MNNSSSTRSFIILILLYMLSIQCSDAQQRQSSYFIDKKYDSSGRIILEQRYRIDSTDTVKDGYLKEYHDGNLVAEGSYINGLKCGLHTLYYDNGIAYQKMYVFTNFILGPFYEYNEDGTLMLYVHNWKMTPYDEVGLLRPNVFIHFNNDGTIDTMFGSPIAEVEIESDSSNTNTTSYDTTFVKCYFMPAIDHTHYLMEVSTRYGASQVTCDSFTSAEHIEIMGRSMLHIPVFRQKGTAGIKFTYYLFNDKDNSLLLKDSATITVPGM